jgi:hypothetical protein
MSRREELGANAAAAVASISANVEQRPGLTPGALTAASTLLGGDSTAIAPDPRLEPVLFAPSPSLV